MRTPLHDVLTDETDAVSGTDPGRGLAVLFEGAERRENAFAAERLREIYEVAERAMSLGAETAAARQPIPTGGASLSQRAVSVGAGLLLAASAPVVAAESVLLAAASGLCAVAALVVPLFGASSRKEARPALPPPDPARHAAKLEAVAAAADRALQAMVEPRRLAAPSPAGPALSEEDVAALIQDALALGRESAGEAAAELAENAGRLARRLGYTPVYEGDERLFEIMVDPALATPLVLRPALVHADEGRSVPGVMVKGRQR